ncbi:hypothetical protein EBU94_07085 [bacterium]|nr:hypothetical protein [bacterium]
MTNYLLIAFGTFQEGVSQDIALALTPVVDSETLKFQKNESVLIFHFGTEVHPTELKDYIQGVLFGITSTYIMTEMSDKVSVVMPDEFLKHLMDLNSAEGDIPNSLNMTKVKNNQIDIPSIDDDEIDEDILALLLGKKKHKVKRPSIDEILDKIQEKGLNGISPFEREILDNYGK